MLQISLNNYKIVRSDIKDEYDGQFNAICKDHGIIYQTIALYSLKSNGVCNQEI